MLVNNCFDLSGVNIFAAGYNHVFQAAISMPMPFQLCFLSQRAHS
jgi:hypothetical protein